MNNYRRLVLILGISLVLLSLISNTALTTVRRVEAKAAAHVDERSGTPARDITWPQNTRLDPLFGSIASDTFTRASRTEPFATLPQAGATFTVNSTADPGTGLCDQTECTLREAITAANALVGTDTIAFNIPSPGPYTISPTSPLPSITSPVVIDGYTQPGASPNTLADDDNAVLMIELNGSLAGALNLIYLTAGSSTVRGLVIHRAARAIAMDTNGGNTIEGNFIGTNVAGNSTVDGSTNLGNDYGVLISTGSSNNVIGGTTPAARNLISGNSFGVALLGGPSIVQGNFIGTDHTGSNDLGNSIGISVTASSNNTIGGTLAGARNVISGNANGIRMQADNNVIQGNYIGVNARGVAFTGTNNTFGVITFGTGSTIGGTAPAARNVISGHAIGISIGGPSTTVQGNFIGTDAAGTARLGNTTAGIDMQLSNNSVIGGTAAGAGNLISANGNGIQLSPSSTGMTYQIQGNLIGTDVSGTANLSNTGDGISINDAAARAGTNITIGGTTPGARNIISGNNGDGIDLRTVTGVVVQGNLIGTQIDGTSPLGNSGHGINMVAALSNTIGGTTPGAGNRIAFNGAGLNFGGGVIIEGSTSNNNSVRGNSIYANTSNGTMTGGGLGIDLSISGSGNGPTLNDSCDSDTGPNNRQNFPVITSAIGSGGTTSITGSLNSTAGTAFTIDFYSSSSCDSSSYGEGQTFLGSTTVNTDSSCNANINVTLPVTLAPAAVVTATAIDPQGNTSEFSQCALAVGMNPPVANNDSFSTNEDTALNVAAPGVLVNDTDADPGTTLTAQLVAGPSNGTLGFNQNGSFIYTPAANFNGTDSFTYRASDGTNTSNTATVQITVNPVNDQPVADVQSVTTNEDTAKAITLTGSDVEGSVLTYSVVTGPTHGSLSGTAPNLTYTPAADYNGSDTFTFKVNDGTVDSNIANVSLTIAAVNDAPVAINDSYNTAGNSTLTVPVPGVLGNDTDVEGNALTAILVSNSSNGTLSFNPNGSFTYTPHSNTSGTDSFTYRANDGSADSNVAAVTISVTAAPTPTPTPTPTTVQFSQSSYSIVEACTSLRVTITRSGDISGTATVEYQTTDGTATRTMDYNFAAGRLSFAPSETSKTIYLLINDDAKIEGTEELTISLSNPSGGNLGTPATATIEILDNNPESTTNVIDNSATFICQQYHDFLNRDPESGPDGVFGTADDSLQYYLNIMNDYLNTAPCTPGDIECNKVIRGVESANFLRSAEFQRKGSYVMFLYMVSIGQRPVTPAELSTRNDPTLNDRPHYAEFMTDLQSISTPNDDPQLTETKKAALADAWMLRVEIQSKYGSLSNTAFVQALLDTADITIPNQQALVDDLNAGRKTRAQVLRAIAESPEVTARFYKPAFVTMGYFGYLHRDPEDCHNPNNWTGGNVNQCGYIFHNNRFDLPFHPADVENIMVRGFIESPEYRQRFGP